METKKEKIFHLFGLEIPRRTAIILLIFVLVSMVVVGIQIYNRKFAAQGEGPALVSLAYDRESGETETVEQYIQRIQGDIQHSVDVMTQYLGEAPAFFAYPYGRYTQELIDVVKDCGFPMAFTVKNGRLDFSVWDVYLLPRYNVDNSFDLEKYAKLLSY